MDHSKRQNEESAFVKTNKTLLFETKPDSQQKDEKQKILNLKR